MNYVILVAIFTVMCCSEACKCSAQDNSLQAELDKLDFQLRDMKSSSRSVERDFPKRVKRTVEAYWDNKQIATLVESKEDTIAILGAWRLTCGANKDDALGSVHWFCGFFEGRTGLRPPDEWKHRLGERFGIKIIAPSEHIEIKSNLNDFKMPQDIPVGNIFIRVYKAQNIHVDGDRISFRQNDLICEVDRLSLQVSGKGRREIEYAMNSEHLAIALSSAPSMSDILLFDSKSGKLLWHRQTWGNLEGHAFPSQEYSGFEHPTVLLRSEKVAVFGETGSPYCEIYECKTGACLLRFSSSTWHARL